MGVEDRLISGDLLVNGSRLLGRRMIRIGGPRKRLPFKT